MSYTFFFENIRWRLVISSETLEGVYTHKKRSTLGSIYRYLFNFVQQFAKGFETLNLSFNGLTKFLSC